MTTGDKSKSSFEYCPEVERYHSFGTEMGVGESTVKYGKWKHFRERKDHAGNLCSDGVL